ncbi:heavy-metal-associated domain-containing protein [Microvirga mediterraneensis]|uniref:Heavy-metal-associated domain-containing protein n=1 Tax=Microvirga mediterraneensis TaxID=2754695 RepID=A0A838BW88_9HYPH|nr:heavy-metal-associated domain-containing protein [Microvirga mediterraneensis]MBA1158776.1 heavy-metal-associated domain-containing protein [Microvirga mediterraneensis]
MCGCSSHSTDTTNAKGVITGAFTFQVDDMTCGHCAGTIKKAIETRLPGTEVVADPQAKTVAVKGASDFTVLKAIVAEAGYTAAL